MPGLNSTRAEAAERSNHLAIKSYQVSLDLTLGDEIFDSITVVKFSCNKAGYETFIDAVGRNDVVGEGLATDAGTFADTGEGIVDLVVRADAEETGEIAAALGLR